MVATDDTLLRQRRNNINRMLCREVRVKPEEVAITAHYSMLGIIALLLLLCDSCESDSNKKSNVDILLDEGELTTVLIV